MPRVLYHTPLSPFCRKMRICLREKELDFDLVDENIWEGRQPGTNPINELPILVEENGAAISGDYAISEYLEETCPERPLIGKTSAERAEVRRLVDWFDTKFYFEVTHKIVYEKIFKKLLQYGEPNSQAIRLGKRNIIFHLEYIAHLCEQRNWLAGPAMTMADIAAAAQLSALDYVGDVPWEYHPTVCEWYALIKSRPSFRSILSDRVTGFKPPVHYEDPDFY